MAVDYFVRFGFGNPADYTGLSPTFLVFKDASGANITPPSIAEVGTTTGVYKFSYGTTTYMTFLVDAATTSPGNQGRYVSGSLSPADDISAYGQTLIAYGETITAIGLTTQSLVGSITLAISGIGSTASSFGSTSTDPGDLFGYMKRIQELLEGNASFNKTSDTWALYSRGSSTLLREKSLSSNAIGVTKI